MPSLDTTDYAVQAAEQVQAYKALHKKTERLTGQSEAVDTDALVSYQAQIAERQQRYQQANVHLLNITAARDACSQHLDAVQKTIDALQAKVQALEKTPFKNAWNGFKNRFLGGHNVVEEDCRKQLQEAIGLKRQLVGELQSKEGEIRQTQQNIQDMNYTQEQKDSLYEMGVKIRSQQEKMPEAVINNQAQVRQHFQALYDNLSDEDKQSQPVKDAFKQFTEATEQMQKNNQERVQYSSDANENIEEIKDVIDCVESNLRKYISPYSDISDINYDQKLLECSRALIDALPDCPEARSVKDALHKLCDWAQYDCGSGRAMGSGSNNDYSKLDDAVDHIKGKLDFTAQQSSTQVSKQLKSSDHEQARRQVEALDVLEGLSKTVSAGRDQAASMADTGPAINNPGSAAGG